MPAFQQLFARTARLAFGLVALGALGPELSAQALDRTQRPTPTEQPPLTFPAITVRKLANGIDVAVMRDTRLPVVSIQAVLDISAAVDPVGKTGLGSFTQSMLDEGTTSRTADQIAVAAAALGGGVSATSVYTITANLDSALALMADQLLHPSFPEAALERLRANELASLQHQKESPDYLAGAVFRRLVYGVDHPYSREETEASVKAITRDDLVAFHARYIRPPNIRFVVVGDITPDEAVAKLKPYFEGLPPGTSGRVDIPAPSGPGQTKVYLYDRPGSPQSIIMIGTLGPRRDTPDYQAIRVMNSILGGAFSSRINLNLRERHGYTYGARTGFTFRRVPEIGGFSASADVQTNKTDSAAIEFMRELREIREERPVTAEEFKFARDQLIKQLPLQFETIQQRASAITNLLMNNLPLNYYETLSAEIAAVTPEQTEATAKKYLTPDQFAIVVVGDRKLIEPGLRAANLAPVVVVDLDGKPVAP
jgi:zinc protease